MVFSCRYFDIDETGKVISGRTVPLENSIDAINMVEPEMPTDAIYELYYNETDGLHWVKTGDFEPETPSPTEDELQWQAITDLEISQMEYDQALTDLELAYLEGSAE